MFFLQLPVVLSSVNGTAVRPRLGIKRPRGALVPAPQRDRPTMTSNVDERAQPGRVYVRREAGIAAAIPVTVGQSGPTPSNPTQPNPEKNHASQHAVRNLDARPHHRL